ncbi:hypothetical protein [Rubripirellula lacrimiformis]
MTVLSTTFSVARGAGGDRARSDGDARYLHHIDLYDINNRKITSESTLPYSPLNTCGRCHDYQSISHGWHFNAFDVSALPGRDGEPWIWTDARTGTQLPLTYRDWSHSFDPRDVGISAWAMTHKFGGRLPGGGVGEAERQLASAQPPSTAADDADDASAQPTDTAATIGDRWAFSGALEIDCLACHAMPGVYDISARRAQIEDENFAWAPTAALRLGEIKGSVSRIKDGSDPDDEAIQSKLPVVTYDPRNFAMDGTVFVDLVRQPTSNACYQCHSQRTVGDDGIEQRWIHDEDVHLRAGMDCADCHRNGIDHDISRGFVGQDHSQPWAIQTLSCQGCHLGAPESELESKSELDSDFAGTALMRSGRLGAPKPLHEGLPPIHFEKLACTACHSGPATREEAVRMMTSLAHGLGEKGHRTGSELPAIVGNVFTRRDDGRVYPHKAMWPAYWGTLQEDQSIVPLNPEDVYQWTRKSLRVRSDFVEEILQPKLKSSELTELLGADRAKVKPDQWDEDEQAKVQQRQAELGEAEFQEKVATALMAIESELSEKPAAAESGPVTVVYVSSGRVYALESEAAEKGSDDADDAADEKGPPKLRQLDDVDDASTGMVAWPMAHNVRPAGWSLGTQGCTECHSDGGMIFASTVTAIGPVAGDGTKITMASLQGVDPVQRQAWNQMFGGRKTFKYFVAGSLATLLAVIIVGLGMLGSRLFYRQPTSGGPQA